MSVSMVLILVFLYHSGINYPRVYFLSSRHKLNTNLGKNIYSICMTYVTKVIHTCYSMYRKLIKINLINYE
jgi:hypothetical protein